MMRHAALVVIAMGLVVARHASAQSPILIYSPGPNVTMVPSPTDGAVILEAISATPRTDFYVAGHLVGSAAPQSILPTPAAKALKPGSYYYGVFYVPTKKATVTIRADACALPLPAKCTGKNLLARSEVHNVGMIPVIPVIPVTPVAPTAPVPSAALKATAGACPDQYSVAECQAFRTTPSSLVP